MKIRNYLLGAVFLWPAALFSQLQDLPQTFDYKDQAYWDLHYPAPHNSWYPGAIDQLEDVEERYLYLGPLGVRGFAHVPERMNIDSNKAITNSLLRNQTTDEIEIPYYEVYGVTPDSPADSFLLEGDFLVGVGGVDLQSGSLYNPTKTYATKSSRNLMECLGDAIDVAEGTGSLTFKVMRIPESATETIPAQSIELHRTAMIDDGQDRFIEVSGLPVGGLVHLIVEDAGDGGGGDHSYWLDARWVHSDGTETYIIDQEWLSASVGWHYPEWGTEITYSGGTTTRTLFAHAPSKVIFRVPSGMDKIRVSIKNNSSGSIVGVVKTRTNVVDYGDLAQYITEVTIPVAKIGSYLAGGAERQHKLDQIMTSQAAWLIGEQRVDGGFTSWGGYTSDPWDTSYIGLALLAADEPRFTEAAKRAAYYIVNEGSIRDWSSPRGIVLTFLSEYYLRTGDAGILPGVQTAVQSVERAVFISGYTGHKMGVYGYGSWGQNSGFSYIAMGLAVASRTPVNLDPSLLERVMARMDAMAVSGTIGYGKSHTSTLNPNESADSRVAMTGPCVAANSITGTSQRFFDLAKIAHERGVGGLDYGHSTQTFGLFAGTIATINLGDALYAQHQALTMPKMILQRNYAGGVIASECINEYMGAENFFRPRISTAIQILTLAAGRRNLAITGKAEIQASVMKPGNYTHVWDLETHRFYLRGWAMAITLLGSDAPASLKAGYTALKEVGHGGAIYSLRDRIDHVMDSYALTAVGEINALGVSNQLKAEAVEMLLGVDLELTVTEKDLDKADIKLSIYWPLRDRNRWEDDSARDAWKANSAFKMVGDISIANASKIDRDVYFSFDSSTDSATGDWEDSYTDNLGSVEVSRSDSSTAFTLPVQISYTVGTHSISYTRDVIFEADLGGSHDDRRYVTIPSCRVARMSQIQELAVVLDETGEYLAMYGPLDRTWHQGERIQVDFRQYSIALGGYQNATLLNSEITYTRGTITPAPDCTMTQTEIEALEDSDLNTKGRSQALLGQVWGGFEMDLGSVMDINGISLLMDGGIAGLKIEAWIDSVWQKIYVGGHITGTDYFDSVRTQKIRVYFHADSSGYTASLFDVQVLYNPYGADFSYIAQTPVEGALSQWSLWQDKFDGIAEGTIESLISNANYPNAPSSSGPLDVLDSRSGIGDNYGQRWSGWITPDETGAYMFYAAADDQVELYLSTDEHPASKMLIASKYSWVSHRQWSSAATSGSIDLVAGKRYYVELLHAEANGGDHCALAWKKPSDASAPADGSAPIGDAYLSSLVGGIPATSGYVFPSITSQPSNVVATAGQPVSITVVANGMGTLTYQWQQNGLPVLGATSTTYHITEAGASDLGNYNCLVKNEYGQVLSQSVTLSFINETPVVDDQSFLVPDFTVSGVVVGSVNASDPDVGDSLDYAITAGNSAGEFSIDSATGEISTAANVNHHQGLQYMLEVTVSDDGMPVLSDTAYVTVTVQYFGFTDTDHDGFPDELEDAVGSDRNDAGSQPSALYSGLYTWWQFDEASGATAVDSSGFGRNGVATGGPGWVAGYHGNAVKMDGVDDLVTYAMEEKTFDAYTFALWVKADNVNSTLYDSVFTNHSSGSNFQLDTNSGNPGVYRFNPGPDYTFGAVTSDWVHLVLAYDGTVTKLYYNGAYVRETSNAGNVFGRLRMGGDRNLTNYFAGAVDDLMLWDRALSGAQVAELEGQASSTNIAPVAQDVSFFLANNVSVGTSLGTLVATDANSGDTLTYEMISGDSGNEFTISSSGEITTAATPLIGNQYLLSVKVSDNGTPSRFDVATVTLQITVINTDVDGDGLLDTWEMDNFGTLATTASDESDHDGLTAYHEMAFGCNPLVNDSNDLHVQGAVIDDAGTAKFEFGFRRPKNHATLNVIYQLQQGTDMVDVNWVDFTAIPTVSDDPNHTNNEWLIYKLSMPEGAESRVFYRCRVISQ